MTNEYEDIETTPDAEQESGQLQTVIPDDGSEVDDTTITIEPATSIEREVAEFEKEAGDGIEEVPEKTGDGEEAPTREAEEKGEQIPDEFTTAAKAVNWSDEQIVDFVSENDYSDEQLIEMIPHLKAQDKKEEPEESAIKKEPEKPAAEAPVVPIKVDADAAAQINAYIDAQIKARTDSLEKRLSQVQEDSSMKELIQFENTANDFFDAMGSDQIGKTKELPKFPDGRYVPTDPRFKARSQMYDMALLLTSKGQSFDKALKNAAAWYKGLHLEAETERKVIKKLKASQKRLSPQRYNKITEPVYESEEDRRADIVRVAAEQAGLKKFD
ncbi:MAG: hypothetical protein KKB38_20850 [Gammaproteobacteria bacterium]|nr:hypothetical protein [Gammaproteobacteria bacterium]